MERFSFGLLADPQYADKPPHGGRFYRETLQKVVRCMDILRSAGVDFVVCLGDMIDGAADEGASEKDWRMVQAIIETLGKPCYHVLGNHDVNAISRARLISLGGFPDDRGYFAFTHRDTQCVVLDTNYDGAGKPYKPGEGRWDECYVNAEQLDWLSRALAACDARRCLVFTHALLDGAEPRHTVKNAVQVRTVLERSGKTHVVFQGHYHAGHAGAIHGIPYLTVRGLVDGPDAYSCWVVTVSGEGIDLTVHSHEGKAHFTDITQVDKQSRTRLV